MSDEQSAEARVLFEQELATLTVDLGKLAEFAFVWYLKGYQAHDKMMTDAMIEGLALGIVKAGLED